MKRLSVFVALALVLCFGLAYGERSVTFTSISNSFDGGTKLNYGNQHDILIDLTNTGAPPGDAVPQNYNINNGLRLYSPDGATWTYPEVETIIEVIIPGVLENTFIDSIFWAFDASAFFNQVYARVYFSTDGMGADTVGYAGAASLAVLGLTPGTNHVPYFRIPIATQADDSGKTICLDSSWFPPGGTWKWAPLQTGGTQITPDWSGEVCWMVDKIPNLPPEFTVCPANYSFSHCVTGTFQVTATDAEQDAITYSLVSGPGSVNAATGVWTWSGPSVPQSGFEVVVIGATDANGSGQTTECSVNVEVTNIGPAFLTGCGASKTIQAGTEGCFTFTASDDCDTKTFYVVDNGGLGGAIGFTGNVLCVTPDPPAGAYTITVGVTDGELSSENCQVRVDVIEGAPYVVVIEKDEGPDGDGAYQGQFTDVDIILEKANTDEGFGLGGFNLLIAYDNSALSFQQAFEGSIYDECGWEYFEYRFGADGNCGGGCPSGLLRVVGIAEMNNGPHHPGCEDTPYVNGLPTTLAVLRFLVSNDRTLECQYAPIRFFWVDCGDNTLSNWDGELLFLSSKVFDFDQEDPLVPIQTFPNYTGAIDLCLEGDKGAPSREIDFFNGGVDIICADSIDARGDVNINGIAYEIADAVMLTNYFIRGLAAFGTHVEASIAASDANADGIPLTVADLVYLIRVVVGDALPYPKTNPVAMNYTVSNGVVSVQGEVGAAFIVAEGEFAPTLLANNMDMKYAHVDGNTRILVYGLDAGDAFTGSFVQIGGEILSIEMATYAGAPIVGENMPTDFSLEQNYPNPFNPTSTIRMNLPTRTDWTVTFYNVTGQVVDVVSGTDQGRVEFTWDATNYASGIYFYKLDAGDYSETRKAVLLK